MKWLGESIRDLRIIHDLQQKEFAKRIGVSRTYLCQIEQGYKRPSFPLLMQMSNSFGIPIHDFMILAVEKISIVKVEGLPESIQLILKIREYRRNIRKKEAGDDSS